MIKEKLTVLLELTRRCNLKCSHCYNNSSPDSKLELEFTDIEKIVKDIKNLTSFSIDKIILTGGEFVYMKDALKIYKYIRENINCKIRIETNGILFFKNPELFNQFDADEFYISADSFHGSINKEGQSEILDYFIEKSRKYNFTITSRLTLKQGEDEIGKLFLNRYKDYKMLDLEIKFVSPSGRAKEKIENEYFQSFTFNENPDLFKCLANNMIHMNVHKKWYACYTACNLSFVCDVGDSNINKKIHIIRESEIFKNLKTIGMSALVETVCNESQKEDFYKKEFYYRCEPCLYLQQLKKKEFQKGGTF